MLPTNSHNPHHTQIMHALSHRKYMSNDVTSFYEVKNAQHKLLSLIAFHNEGIFRKTGTESRLDIRH